MVIVNSSAAKAASADSSAKRSYNLLLLLVAGLGGLLYGIDVGIIGGALPYLEATSHLTAGQLSVIVAAVLLGSVFSTLFAGLLADWLGRKPLMILSGLAFVAQHSRHRALAGLRAAVLRPPAAGHQRRIHRRRRSALPRRVPCRLKPRQRHGHLSVAADVRHRCRCAGRHVLQLPRAGSRRKPATQPLSSSSKTRHGAASSGSRFRRGCSSSSAASWSPSRRAGSSAAANASRPMPRCCARAPPSRPRIELAEMEATAHAAEAQIASGKRIRGLAAPAQICYPLSAGLRHPRLQHGHRHQLDHRLQRRHPAAERLSRPRTRIGAMSSSPWSIS